MEKPQEMEVEDEYTLTLLPGTSAIQGRRPYMEDRHTVLIDLLAKETGEGKSDDTTTTTTSTASTPSTRNQHSFFAVYDGHGGQFASTFASENLYKHLASSNHLASTPTQALHEACDTTDRLYAESHKTASSQDGSTACMVLIAGRKVITANVGDSRAVMCRNGEPLPLSFDHKPDKKEERQRIEEAGGIVKKGSFFNIPMGPFRVYQGDGVRGGLAVSRALGDTFYKDPSKPKEQWLVSGIPEITQETLTPGEDEFILVASDGFWDVFTNEVSFTTRDKYTANTYCNYAITHTQHTHNTHNTHTAHTQHSQHTKHKHTHTHTTHTWTQFCILS
eukprot:TRINITY_DN2272_c3_g2_i3.p1 TRINITY_DN2272_c3_g2~~TRINITY_DN2272_c3_g2_i3.p1  ORF type:complete len:334 (+),score=68.12 TRINITY_DN2272_c3_g2_i3:143-1144(+)